MIHIPEGFKTSAPSVSCPVLALCFYLQGKKLSWWRYLRCTCIHRSVFCPYVHIYKHMPVLSITYDDIFKGCIRTFLNMITFQYIWIDLHAKPWHASNYDFIFHPYFIFWSKSSSGFHIAKHGLVIYEYGATGRYYSYITEQN